MLRPHTPTLKRYDSLSDKDFVEKSDFRNLGLKLYWLDIILHPVPCGICFLEKLRFFSKMTHQLIISWPDHSSPRWFIYDLNGFYGYQNDREASLILNLVTISHIDDVITKLWRHNCIFYLGDFVQKITSFAEIVSRFLSIGNLFQTPIYKF